MLVPLANLITFKTKEKKKKIISPTKNKRYSERKEEHQK